jgi:hypothetical protein
MGYSCCCCLVVFLVVLAAMGESLIITKVANASNILNHDVVANASNILNDDVVANTSNILNHDVVANASNILNDDVVANTSNILNDDVVANASNILNDDVVANASNILNDDVVATGIPTRETDLFLSMKFVLWSITAVAAVTCIYILIILVSCLLNYLWKRWKSWKSWKRRTTAIKLNQIRNSRQPRCFVLDFNGLYLQEQSVICRVFDQASQRDKYVIVNELKALLKDRQFIVAQLQSDLRKIQEVKARWEASNVMTDEHERCILNHAAYIARINNHAAYIELALHELGE